jgi:hypothetical protein
MLLTLREAAHRLNLSEPTARRVLKGIAILVGKRLKYPAIAVERFAERGCAA